MENPLVSSAATVRSIGRLSQVFTSVEKLQHDLSLLLCLHSSFLFESHNKGFVLLQTEQTGWMLEHMIKLAEIHWSLAFARFLRIPEFH